MSYETSFNGIALLQQLEGCKLNPYLDSENIPTIGVGTTYYPDGTQVTMQDAAITQEQALNYLSFSLQSFENKINGNSALSAIIDKQCKFDALVCLIYNIGYAALLRSQCYQDLIGGDIHQAMCEWNWGEKQAKGLIIRRATERHLFCTGSYEIVDNY